MPANEEALRFLSGAESVTVRVPLTVHGQAL